MSPGPKKHNRRRNEERHTKSRSETRPGSNVGILSIENDSSIRTNDESHETFPEIDLCAKKYKNRNVTSNWNRYEESFGNEDEQVRGIDYQTALSCAGSAISQFRFEDEKDWEEESTSLKIDANDFTSIDTDILSNTLECISLHKRLDISEEFFMPEVLHMLCSNADLKRKSYIPSTNSRLICDKKFYQTNVQTCVVDGIIESLTSLHVKEEPKDKTKNKDVLPLMMGEPAKEVDNELEMLLSLSENKNYEIPVKNVIKKPSHCACASTVETRSNELSTVATSSKMNIDDWLDSMIED